MNGSAATHQRIRVSPPQAPGENQPVGPDQQMPAPDLDLGMALLEEGIITAEEVRRNLPKAMGNPGFLKLLLYCPMVSESELASLLSVRHQVPLLDLDAMEIPQNVIASLSAKLVYELECLPLALVGDILCVGVADIRNRTLIDRLRTELGNRRVKVFPCEPSQLRKFIVRHYVVPSPSLQPDQNPALDSSEEVAQAHGLDLVPPAESDPVEPTIEVDRDAMEAAAARDEAVGSRAALEPRTSLVEEEEEVAGKVKAESKEQSGGIEIPAGFSPDLETAETPQAPSESNFAVDLSEDDLEDYLASMQDLEEDHSGFEYFRAEPVPEEEFFKAAAFGESIEAQWEKVHFSHAPVRAEPVALGFPGEVPFAHDDDALLP